MKINFLLAIMLCSSLLFAQQSKIDSLNSELSNSKEDSNKVKTLVALSSEMIYKSDYMSSRNYATEAILLSRSLNYLNGEASALGRIGLINWLQGDYPGALENLFSSLKIFENISDRKGIATSYNTLGLVYWQMKKFPEAMSYFKKSKAIHVSLKDEIFIARNNHNIGIIYQEQGNYTDALNYFSSAIKVFKKIKDKRAAAVVFNNVGQVYFLKKNIVESLKNYYEALKLFKESGNLRGQANTYNLIANVYLSEPNYTLASENIKNALILAKLIGSKEYIKDSYKNLTRLDSAVGNWKSAYQNQSLFKLYSDSILNEKSLEKTIQEKMAYEFDKKESAIIAEQDRKEFKERIIRYSIIIGLVGALIFLIVVYRQRNKISKEKARSEELLLNILPEAVAEELKEKGEAEAKLIEEVTVLFTDFKGFTSISEKLNPKELVKDIHECFSAFDSIMQKNNMEKIKTIGDSYMAAGGLPTTNKTHAIDAINAAIEIVQFIEDVKVRKLGAGLPYFDIRIGIHTGPVVAGIVGVKKFAYDIWGDAVNTASRMESSGDVGKINISETTFEKVKDIFQCQHRGRINAKGKGEIDMYFVC